MFLSGLLSGLAETGDVEVKDIFVRSVLWVMGVRHFNSDGWLACIHSVDRACAVGELVVVAVGG